ncbi:MobF family relaxase [Nocardia brasiliensis]|uniref:MobF family relaxase n=1 Tax=Nocardia brasiliensis TaxID=37326 RepID=UPI0005A11300|nr:MobF family relaxase [Nocardia brasiliensis]
MTATIHKVVAGNGYQYYLRKVAANDVDARGRSDLADYYSAHGEAPGRWHGSGLGPLGLEDGAEVTESQMNSLFGLGRHPNAELIEDRVYAGQIELGANDKDATRAADKASRLGHPYRVYADVSGFRKRCARAFEQYNIECGLAGEDVIPEPERSRIRTRVAFDMFSEQYERAPVDARELSGWVAKNSRPHTTAVAGFDVTFSPVKSVSVLWAVAPRAVSEKIEAAHRAAIDDALRWLERHAVFTRLGRNGIRQVDVDGVIAAVFTHRDSRAGDPDLHTHVLIANRVRTAEGKWRTLDGAAIYRALVTVSEIYNTRLEHHCEQMAGLEFAERPGQDPSKRPIREIVGIPQSLITAWSRRDAAITTRLGELAAAFQTQHGREPTPGEMFDLAERATLDTRPAKHLLRSLAEQRGSWRAEAVRVLGGRKALSAMVHAALNPARTVRPPITGRWITRTAQHVIEVVSEHRSTWRATNVRAEIERQLRGKVTGRDWESVAEAVLAETLSPAHAVAIGDPDLADEPELTSVPVVLRRRDGTSVYTSANQQLYTSARTLSVEAELIELSVQAGARQLPADVVAAAIAAYNTANPDRTLNAGQVSVIEGFARSGLRVRTTNAPAGSGKTTAMAVLANAWAAAGGQVLGLAPTAAAAAVLGESIGYRVETVDKVLDVLDQHTLRPDNAFVEREFPPPLPQWILDIDPATLVIVDEHVKIGNLKRLRLLRYLTGRGATIRCIGDPRQLSAIEAGGADADMDAAAPEPALTLTHVVRFDSAGEATASLQLRDGDPIALGWYLDHGRIHAGHEGATHDDAFHAWTADYLNGRDSVMLAANHTTVTALNARARADRLARDGTQPGATCLLIDGLEASVGDAIRTRHNDPQLRLGPRDWVRNGYAWTVTAVHDDGSLTATHLRSGAKHGHSVLLPGDYVSEHVRLGYATTVDSAQGITADTCHVALTGYESRNQLYVALTRGIFTNHLYLPTALDGSEGSFWSEPAAYPRTAIEILLRILDRDGTQKSAHTTRRDALDPYRRIGRALDIYLDSIGLAAENALGTDGLDRLDADAERAVPHLTDCPAYPILRQHLATIALAGRDPIAALCRAKNARELDTADDIAAVLDWRLDSTGTHSSGGGPLPWVPGIPDGLTGDHDHHQLGARARILADLIGQIRADTQQWTPASAPRWARPLLGSHPQLVEELAVWRASLHIDDRDPHSTGPARRSVLERDHQQLLDARTTEALGDLHRPANTWAPTVKTIAARVVTDPWWPIIAEKIDIAARAGIDIQTLLTGAARTRALPDEMPAAALWSRLDLEPSALDTPHAHTMRPDWITDLHTILGTTTAERAITDAAWPRLVAAIDRATGSDWTPYELLATAHELILGAQPFGTTFLRPDQLADALAWRIDALLRQPTPIQQSSTEPEPDTSMHPHDIPTDTQPPDPPPPSEQANLTPVRASDDIDSGGRNVLPDNIATVAALLQAGDLTAARRNFLRLTGTLDDAQRDIIERVATTLYTYPFVNARARLQWAAERYPEHRELIHACTPTTDPHTYQRRDYQPPPPIPREHYIRPAHDLPDRYDPTQIRPPRPDAEIRADQHADEYERTRGDVDEHVEDAAKAGKAENLTDDEKQRLAIPEGVPHRYYTGNHWTDSHPDSNEPDYDQFADLRTTTLPCVCCGISRPAEAHPRPPRRTEDGLCHDCRDDGQPPIPDSEPADRINTRCDHIAAIHPAENLRGLLLRDWRAARTLAERIAISAWVQVHPLPDSPPQQPSVASPIVENALHALTDQQLEQAIDDLELRIALAADDANIYGSAPQSHVDDSEFDDQLRRHRAAQDAIRAVRAAEATLTEAVREARAINTELDTARAALDSTPARRRARRDLQARVDALAARQDTAIGVRESARTALRQAHRDATDITGTTREWDRILTQPAPPKPEHQPAQPTPELPDIVEFENQLDKLRTERNRRQHLTNTAVADEQHLRDQHASPIPDSSDEFDTMNEPYPPPSSGPHVES